MKIFLLLFLNLNVFAYQPPLESLFRNNNNSDYLKNSTYASIKFSRVNVTESKIISEKDWYFKFYMSKLAGRTELLQLNFGKNFTDSEFKSYKYISNFDAKYFYKNTRLMPSLFYSILGMLLQNDSKMILESLRYKGIFIHMNTEKFNNEKLRLLNRYKHYLSRIKQGQDKESAKSPLESSDPTRKQQISELLKESYYKNSEKAKLIRIENKFYWLVERERFTARFENETRRMDKMWFKENDLEVEINFKDYVLFNGINELPENIYFKFSNGENYHLKFLKMANFSDNPTRLYNRLRKYKKLMSKSERVSNEEHPWFILK
jgi:hypothetical protein